LASIPPSFQHSIQVPTLSFFPHSTSQTGFLQVIFATEDEFHAPRNSLPVPKPKLSKCSYLTSTISLALLKNANQNPTASKLSRAIIGTIMTVCIVCSSISSCG
jgi:hypothetical protein